VPQPTSCRHCREPLNTGIERVYGEHIGCDAPRSAANVASPAKPESAPAVLDWSGRDGGPKAGVGDPKKCVACGDLTILRHPDTGLPHHKTCAEKAIRPVSTTN
jgi:hypothetical protein